MIKVFPDTLNIYAGVHPVCKYALDTLVHFCPDDFAAVTNLADCDCVLSNVAAVPPYSFNQELADEIVRLKKPIFIINDGDGYEPDCEGQTPDSVHNLQNFMRGGNGIRACFYREWHYGYERPDLAFPLITFELVGYLWSNHPKDGLDYHGRDDPERFNARPLNMLMAQTIHALSRIAMYKALSGRPRTCAIDLTTGRLPLEAFLEKQSTAKITIALEGSGIKCMSHCEAPLNSVMALPDIVMHETYPWVDGENCIRLVYQPGKGEGSFINPNGRGLVVPEASIEKMQALLADDYRLFEIFKAGVENSRRYSLPNYYRNHIGANIVKYL